MPRSRRTLLKTAGFIFGSGTLVSISGCLSDPPAGSDNSTTDPSTSTTSDSSEKTAATDVTKWLPNPQKTPVRDGYGFLYFDIAGIRSHQKSLHENAYSRLEKQMLRPLWRREYVDVAAVDAAMDIDHISVTFGSFDPEAVVEKLTKDWQSSNTTSTQTATTTAESSWSKPEAYKGFDLYGSDLVYAISEDVLIKASPMVSPMGDGDTSEYVKAVIDAPADESSHYGDGNEYVAEMMGAVDDPDALWCYPEAMDGSTSRGFRKDVITGELKSWRFESKTTHLTWANTYPDAEMAEGGELATYIQSESDRFGAYEGIEVTVEGKLAWTDGTIPTEAFDHLAPGGPDDSITTAHASYRNPL